MDTGWSYAAIGATDSSVVVETARRDGATIVGILCHRLIAGITDTGRPTVVLDAGPMAAAFEFQTARSTGEPNGHIA